MTPATIIQKIRAEGVTLSLSPSGTIKATGDGVAVNRWLGAIREHKAGLVDALKVGAGDTASTGWCLHYTDRDPVHVFIVPNETHAEVLASHPDAIAAEPCTTDDVPAEPIDPEAWEERAGTNSEKE